MIEGMMTPMVMLWALASAPAIRLRRYDSRSIACWIRPRTSAETISGWRVARDTVAVDTPASRATSAIRDRAVPSRSRFDGCGSGIWSRVGSENVGLGGRRPGLQEIEIAALVGLGDMPVEDHAIATPEARRRFHPRVPALCQFTLRNQHLEPAVRHVEHDLVAGLDQRERPADVGFRRDVQHAGA